MGDLFLLIFLALCIGAGAWLLFIWAVKNGQYEDIEGPKYRMLDDDEPRRPSKRAPSRSPASGNGDSAELDSEAKPPPS